MVDLLELLAAEDHPLGCALDFVIEVTMPNEPRYELAGFADGTLMNDADREAWRRRGNLEETWSFYLYGQVVDHKSCEGYRAHFNSLIGDGELDPMFAE